MNPIALKLTVNGVPHDLPVMPWVTLLDLLRERLDLTGTKKGCDHGQCGACTVRLDGRRINSCLKLACTLEGCSVTTIEGLAGEGGDGPGEPGEPGHAPALHPLQQAFIDHDALQCGYCTPGQICSASALLDEGRLDADADPEVLRQQVREWMSGNLCRCGAYPHIVEAIVEVAKGRP